ncbi:MAG: hypothetical protein ACK56I_00055, partial [bacterium]
MRTISRAPDRQDWLRGPGQFVLLVHVDLVCACQRPHRAVLERTLGAVTEMRDLILSSNIQAIPLWHAFGRHAGHHQLADKWPRQNALGITPGLPDGESLRSASLYEGKVRGKFGHAAGDIERGEAGGTGEGDDALRTRHIAQEGGEIVIGLADPEAIIAYGRGDAHSGQFDNDDADVRRASL